MSTYVPPNGAGSVPRFRDAYATEKEHLEMVRGWMLEATLAGEPAKALA